MDLPEGYYFRRAVTADGQVVQEIIFSILEEYGLDPDPGHADRGLADIDKAFAEGWLNLVINPDGEIAGTVGFLPLKDDETCELTKMFLKPAYRGKGLGHAMIASVITAAREGGYRKIELETATALKEAIGLYQRYGFQEVAKANITSRCNKVMVLTL